MEKDKTEISLDHVYDLRKRFTVIGLTGKTGSGCSDVSSLLTKGFDKDTFTDPKDFFRESRGKSIHNAYRSHRISYNYAKENFVPYSEIKYKDVISLFLLQEPLEHLIKYLKIDCWNEFTKDKFPTPNFSEHIKEVEKLSEGFQQFELKVKALNIPDIKENKENKEKLEKLYELFFNSNSGFKDFSVNLHKALGKGNIDKSLDYHRLIQIISNNLRKTGKIYESESSNFDHIFTIVTLINVLIKSHRKCNIDRTQIVINSLKNPLEIMFFKQRYAAFYAIAVHKNPELLKMILHSKFGGKDELTEKIIDLEYKGDKDKDFHYQKVEECLQLSDIHLSFLDKNDVIEENKKAKGLAIKIQPCFTWQDQILKYLSLIDHPGLVPPSSEERCMQLAFTAKYNSGCISRQVGAAITDRDYSIKAIGWNNTPSGQVPCSLRNANDLIQNSYDIDAFTNYERTEWNKMNDKNEYTSEFHLVLSDNFENKVSANYDQLRGRNVCYCFKTLKNSYSEGKNQVHTRSLHAEENAFLQLTKYGGTGIRNGILFSTASPCELCSKKAYQLGIKLIYYIDPYPGISKSQILSSGETPIETKLFSGAIGAVYSRLYQPFMSYKDELSLILGHNIQDMVTKLMEENKALKEQLNQNNNGQDTKK